MEPSIRFNNVSKRYRVGRRIPSLRDMLGNLNGKDADKFYWAVNDVSFELFPGESLGIIGPNGAGKTTILKLLSHVTPPTSGNIKVNGRFSALIELGAGFHPDLTGRENIFLNGTILGMRRSEIKARFDQIVEFSNIGQFLDTPVKRYSSGMYARLGFAIAAHVDPEVLLVDEVLAVGDYAFRMKCYKRMDELREKGTTLIFVSHNMEDIRRVCQKGLVMYRGEKAFEGSSSQIVAEYVNILRKNTSTLSNILNSGGSGLAERRMTQAAKIEEVAIVDQNGTARLTVSSGETVFVSEKINFNEDAESPVFACTLTGENGEVVYDTTTRLMGIETPNFRKGESIIVKFKLHLHLLEGVYQLKVDLAYSDLSCYYDFVGDALRFVVTGGSKATGVADLGAEIAFESLS